MTGDRSVQETDMRNCLPVAIFIASKNSSIGKISMIMISEGGRVYPQNKEVIT